MSILIVDAETRARVAAMIERARAKPVPWSELRDGALAVDQKTATLTLAERPPRYDRPPAEYITLGSYRAAFSIEQQPSGFVRHLSVSVRRPGHMPSMPAVQEIAALFGFERGADVRFWIEEFAPGHHAANLAQLIAEQPAGHG